MTNLAGIILIADNVIIARKKKDETSEDALARVKGSKSGTSYLYDEKKQELIKSE